MAKKKSESKSKNSGFNLTNVLGFKDIFHNEKLNFVLGCILVCVAIYLILAFISYFSTGAADQSLIEDPRDGEVMNAHHEFSNTCGSVGAYASWYFIKRCFGLPAFLIPVFILLLGTNLIRAFKVNLLKWFLSLMVLMIWASISLAKFLAPFMTDACFNPGGDHGAYICQYIENLVGAPGLTALIILTALAFLTYISAETIFFVRKILNPTRFLDKVKFKITNNDPNEKVDSYEQQIVDDLEPEEEPLVYDDPAPQEVEFRENDKAVIIDQVYKQDPEIPAAAPIAPAAADEVGMEIEVAQGEAAADTMTVAPALEDLEPYDPKRDLENYKYPTLDLLKKYDNDGKPYIDMEEQNANKNRIVEVLRTFGVEISSIKATVGPTITLYEITLAAGVRISKIRSLEDDIALSLSALGIRIIAPIPGLLVAGATGQGKSVGLNAILTSLLYKKHPAEMKIVLVDPKMVEFSVYKTIERHFLAALPEEVDSPIITDTTKVVRTLNSLCVEMDARYELLMAAGERNIKDYNKKFKERKLNPEKGHRYMPYIVVVIDEYGDLIMTAGKEIELPIARIAQKARAVGIHMIIATQRPTTNIITGTIKANFPGRIAFKVSQGIDSKTILDRMGANQLIGRGDMLYLQGNDPIRVQCAFVDTPEVVDINKFIASQQGYGGPYELPEPKMEESDMGGGESADVDLTHLDPLFEDAARLIVSNQSGSTSLIQRKFAIGYNRAGRLMDQLEKAGVVGAAMGSKPREVMVLDEVSLNNLLSNLR